MMKKILAILLVLSVLLPLVPVQARAAEEIVTNESITAMITEQYDAYVASLGAADASDAATIMVQHSVANAGTWNMTSTSEVGKALFHTGLLRSSFIHMAEEVYSVLSRNPDDYVILRGGLNWYDHDMKYSNTAYEYFTDNQDKTDDVRYKPTISVSNKEYVGPRNNYDDAMLLVVGGGTLNSEFIRTSVTPDTITYRVKLTVKDTFDFNVREYKGEDRELEMFLTWTGKLLALRLLTTYDWSVSAEFDLTLPNKCSHESGSYRWEFDENQNPVSVQEEGLTYNPLEHLSYTNSKNETYSYYKSYHAIRLYHDRPWVLEFQCEGKGSFALANDISVTNGYHLRRASTTVFLGEVYKPTPEDKNTYFYYGYKIVKKLDGIVYNDPHVYRLENRIAEDGSNMVWLLIDGVVISPMNHHFLSSKDQETTVDWVSGKDFVFNYIGNKSYPFKNITMGYIQVWENGVDRGTFDYIDQSVTDVTCTKNGYTQNSCSLCGALYAAEETPALGHSFTEWEVFAAPDCTRVGMNSRSCTRCGELETEVVPALGHSFNSVFTGGDCVTPGTATDTCTTCGFVQIREEVPAPGHQIITEPGTPATCTTPGITEGSHCGVCGQVLAEQTVIPAAGHSEVTDPAVAATCTDAGLTEGSHCDSCGLVFTAQRPVDALGHSWDEGTVTSAPGIEQEGQMVYTCTRCQTTRTEILPPVAHTHVYGEWKISLLPTSKTEGEEQRLCECGKVETRVIPALTNPFTDVEENSFYYEPVLWANFMGITAGTSTTTFSPDDSCTRAQVVTFLWRAMGKPEPESRNNPFTDVKQRAYYYDAVLWAVENGITAGTSATTFSPDETCTRAQVVTFLWRTLGKEIPEAETHPFRDVKQGAYYETAVLWAVENSITAGTKPDTFTPSAACIRSQVVTFLYRALKDK